jgi:hypothetical protein
MPRRSLFDRWLIDMATARPPVGREEWARAMRAEFETLDRGRSGWALGCFGAAIGWRLKADGTFFLAAATMLVMLIKFLPWIEFMLLPGDFLHATAYVWTWGPLALACMALAALRPRYWIVIGLAVPAVFDVVNLVQFLVLFHEPISDILRIHVMDAREDVGFGALIGYSLVGAMIGRGLSGSRKRRARSQLQMQERVGGHRNCPLWVESARWRHAQERTLREVDCEFTPDRLS